MTHAYELARQAFTAIVREADPAAAVPACPDWTVHELLARQVHQLAGALDGSFPVADSISRLSCATASIRQSATERQESWIRDGVAEWSIRATGELLQAWSALSDAAPSEVLDALVPDVVVHLLDLQGAVGDRGHRDDALVSEALVFWSSIAEVSVPGNADARFELLRAITGRRSRAQAADLGEDVALYGWRDAELAE